jgi:hypothetical protein
VFRAAGKVERAGTSLSAAGTGGKNRRCPAPAWLFRFSGSRQSETRRNEPKRLRRKGGKGVPWRYAIRLALGTVSAGESTMSSRLCGNEDGGSSTTHPTELRNFVPLSLGTMSRIIRVLSCTAQSCDSCPGVVPATPGRCQKRSAASPFGVGFSGQKPRTTASPHLGACRSAALCPGRPCH